MIARRLCLTVATSTFALSAAHVSADPAPAAQPAQQNTPAQNAQDLYNHSTGNPSVFGFDYGPPSSPALSLLGLSPDTTTPSTTLTKFAMSLPSVFGSTGGQALALDAALPFNEAPAEETYTRYITEERWRLLHRTRLEVAIKNGTLDSGNAANNVASGFAFGASLSVLNSSDPLMARAPGQPGTDSYLTMCLNRLTGLIGQARDSNPQTVAETLLARRVGAAQAAVDHLQSFVSYLAAYGSAFQPALTPAAASKLDADSLDTAAKAEVQFLEAQRDSLQNARNTHTDSDLDALLAKQLHAKDASAAFTDCANGASQVAAFSTDLKLGAGVVWSGAPGQLKNFESPAEVGWLAFKQPVLAAKLPDPLGGTASPDPLVPTSALMLAVSARFGHDEQVQTGNKTMPQISADTINAWGGLEWIEKSWRVVAQYGWSQTTATSTAEKAFSQSGARYLVSTQWLVIPKLGLWLGASYGDAYGTAAALRSSTALVTFSFSPPPPSFAVSPK